MIIPFFIPHLGCPHQCVFCNQKNITGQTQPVSLSAIPRTIREYLKNRANHDPIHVAFYGGSFTALSREMQQSYLDEVRPFILSGQISGIRVSTRPDCVTHEILALLTACHVKTVELGAQSMDDGVLSLSRRGHTSADTRNGVRMLKEGGFSVGLQLMPGLPGDSQGSFLDTVEKAVGLKPDFVRIYPALVIRNTPLERLYLSGEYLPLTLDDAIAVCRTAMLRFDQANIDIIRIGLQPTEELDRPGTVLAGPYHPSFRQIVESSLMLDKMRQLLSGNNRGAGAALFEVNPRDLSTAIGQRHANIIALKKEFGLNSIRFKGDLGRIKRRDVTLLSIS